MRYTSEDMNGELVRFYGFRLPRSAIGEADSAIGFLGASLDREVVSATDSDHARLVRICNIFLRDGERSIGHLVVD